MDQAGSDRPLRVGAVLLLSDVMRRAAGRVTQRYVDEDPLVLLSELGPGIAFDGEAVTGGGQPASRFLVVEETYNGISKRSRIVMDLEVSPVVGFQACGADPGGHDSSTNGERIENLQPRATARSEWCDHNG